MRTLIYKRTHKGDPDKTGWFGINDCMGRVRGHDFDAVIGIGGIGSEAKTAEIDGKVNWIGSGSKRRNMRGRGPLVTFDHFILFDERGADFRAIAPKLARRMYSPNAPRILFDKFSKAEHAEINRLLRLAETAHPSAEMPPPRLTRHCPKCR